MIDLLTPAEVVEEFDVSRSDLKTLEKSGQLEGIVVKTTGGHRRYQRDKLPRILAKHNAVKAKNKGDYTEFGDSGLTRWGGSVYEEKLKELRGRPGRIMYREMRLNDPVIAAIFFALENALRQADWRVSPASDIDADKEAAMFVETCMKDMSWGWNDQLTFIVAPLLEQGHSYLEVVFKKRQGERGTAPSLYDDNMVGWRKWAPRPAESLVDGNEWVFDAAGGIKGANQEKNDGTTVFLPIEKCLLFRTTVYPANSPEGTPIHRPSFLPYWYSNNIMEIEGIGVERDLAGIPIVYLGGDCTLSGDNSDYALAKDLVVNLRNDEQTGIVVPHPKMGDGAPEGQGMLVELLSTGGSKEFDTTKIIERYDKRKAVSLLAQFILLGMDRQGSYALSKNQSDLFVLAAKAWLDGITDVINRHAIPKLIRLNVFPNITGYPQLVPSALGIPDLETISMYVNRLVDKEVLTPDPELERHLRQLANLPQIPIKVEGEEGVPDELELQKKDPERLALLLRRMGMALDPLIGLGVVDEAETYEMLRPLVDEFRQSLLIAKQDHPGLDAVAKMEREIEEAWENFRKDVEAASGSPNEREAIAAATLLLTTRFEKTVNQTYKVLWAEVRSGAMLPGEAVVATKAAQQAIDYFLQFAHQVEGELDFEEELEEQLRIVDARFFRAMMYAGGAWALYNEAKVWGEELESLWRWDGPADERSCHDCLREITAGARPLWTIRWYPGEVECVSNCRCELVRE